MKEPREEVAAALEDLATKIRSGEVIVVHHTFTRGVIERPIDEICGLWKEYEPSKEFTYELRMVSRELDNKLP